MRWFLTVFIAVLGVCVWWLWLGHGAAQIGQWAAAHQRDFQNQIALSLRAVRAGRPEAFWGLIVVCFAYGFFHAVGPGHGKVLIGGYGLARRVALRRLAVISFLASTGQAVTALVLVYGGVLLFQLSRQQMVGAAEQVFAPLSYGMIVLIGLWLVIRGGLRLLRRPNALHAHEGHHAHDHHHGHDHAHHDHGNCESCGHRHGPTMEEIGEVGSLREALALIGGIAIRPCSGALFVLVITWQMGIAMAGIAGAFAMALGTAVVTIGVGAGAIGLRGGFSKGLSGAAGVAARGMPLVEIAAGVIVIILAGGLLFRSL